MLHAAFTAAAWRRARLLPMRPEHDQPSDPAAERDALMLALARIAHARGYAFATGADVAADAGLPTDTFERHFASVEDCLLALCDRTVERLTRAVDAAVEPCAEPGGAAVWATQLHAGFGAVLHELASSPAVASICLVDALSVGRPALLRRDGALDRFVAYVDTLRRTEGEPIPALAAEMLVRGTYELIYARVARGETEQLPELLADLAALWDGPFGPPDNRARRFPRRPQA